MFKEFSNEKHKKQSEQFLLSLGKFVLEFERINSDIRYLIMFTLRGQGLNNQGMEQVIIGDVGSKNLREMLGALYMELPGQDEDDRKEVQRLLKDIEKLTEERNVLIHGDWYLGTEATKEEFSAGVVRFRKKPKHGAHVEQHWKSAREINQLIKETKRVQLLLRRLQICICQPGFKVAKIFKKPL